jgi:hypothetical protein
MKKKRRIYWIIKLTTLNQTFLQHLKTLVLKGLPWSSIFLYIYFSALSRRKDSIYIFLCPFKVRAFEMSSCSDSQLICPLKVQHKNNNYNKIIFLPRGRLHWIDESILQPFDSSNNLFRLVAMVSDIQRPLSLQFSIVYRAIQCPLFIAEPNFKDKCLRTNHTCCMVEFDTSDKRMKAPWKDQSI